MTGKAIQSPLVPSLGATYIRPPFREYLELVATEVSAITGWPMRADETKSFSLYPYRTVPVAIRLSTDLYSQSFIAQAVPENRTGTFRTDEVPSFTPRSGRPEDTLANDVALNARAVVRWLTVAEHYVFGKSGVWTDVSGTEVLRAERGYADNGSRVFVYLNSARYPSGVYRTGEQTAFDTSCRDFLTMAALAAILEEGGTVTPDSGLPDLRPARIIEAIHDDLIAPKLGKDRRRVMDVGPYEAMYHDVIVEYLEQTMNPLTVLERPMLLRVDSAQAKTFFDAWQEVRELLDLQGNTACLPGSVRRLVIAWTAFCAAADKEGNAGLEQDKAMRRLPELYALADNPAASEHERRLASDNFIKSAGRLFDPDLADDSRIRPLLSLVTGLRMTVHREWFDHAVDERISLAAFTPTLLPVIADDLTAHDNGRVLAAVNEKFALASTVPNKALAVGDKQDRLANSKRWFKFGK